MGLDPPYTAVFVNAPCVKATPLPPNHKRAYSTDFRRNIVTPDREQAAAWQEKAEKAEDGEALNSLASRYRYGGEEKKRSTGNLLPGKSIQPWLPLPPRQAEATPQPRWRRAQPCERKRHRHPLAKHLATQRPARATTKPARAAALLGRVYNWTTPSPAGRSPQRGRDGAPLEKAVAFFKGTRGGGRRYWLTR